MFLWPSKYPTGNRLADSIFVLKIVVIGDANGAILAYDALCSNHSLDDTTSLYGEGNLDDLVSTEREGEVGKVSRRSAECKMRPSKMNRKDIRKADQKVIEKTYKNGICHLTAFAEYRLYRRHVVIDK